jgi:predicted phosphohydrolase
MPYPDAAAKNRRNLIVKISNYPPIVRPQTGVNLADVVYEYEVEGGVTRFAAIYRSNMPSRVSSQRPFARP